jgi:hypothetical protein
MSHKGQKRQCSDRAEHFRLPLKTGHLRDGVWDANALIALGRSLRYKRKHRTETAIMGDVVDLKGQPAHLENDLEFIAEAEMARLMLRHGRLTDEARDYIARTQ